MKINHRKTKLNVTDSIKRIQTPDQLTNNKQGNKETNQAMGKCRADRRQPANSGPLYAVVRRGLIVIVATRRTPADGREAGVRDHSTSVLNHPSPRDAH